MRYSVYHTHEIPQRPSNIILIATSEYSTNEYFQFTEESHSVSCNPNGSSKYQKKPPSNAMSQ